MVAVDLLRELYKRYQLHYDPSKPDDPANDIFEHKHYTIITRNGIEKIQRQAGIEVSFTPVYAGENCVIIHAKGRFKNEPDKFIETFASASDKTSRSAYYAEMAEKRALSRIVLKLTGLYEMGIYGQDEFDIDRSQSNSVTHSPRAQFKQQPKTNE